MVQSSSGEPIAERQRAARRLVLSSATLVASAAVARQRNVEPLEDSAFRIVNRLPKEGSIPLRIIMQAGALGSSFVTAGLALLLGRRRLARDLAVSGTLAWLVAKLVKARVARERPAELLEDVIVHGGEATGLGFPSGHAAVSAALATAANPYLPREARLASWVVASIVSFSRVYVGAHLPIDIVGGVPLGVAAGTAVQLVFGILSRSGSPPADTNPTRSEQSCQ
jgi:undecaprenyl-diphosphatase